MKPFDLELAKQGHPVCTRDGRKARIVCWDYQSIGRDRPILALIEQEDDTEETVAFKNNGSFGALGISDYDLRMASVKHEGWVNIYWGNNGIVVPGAFVRDSKDEAKKDSIGREKNLIATVKIEWEE